ncbi:hypothetical protein [Brevundimonas sp. SL130]|uniref:hypothetical protein n=1 Tax=Brevundimonas sp. SL130 TaxID=2995143 RepID=UPI00226D1B0A|nr:hypothetical protein [Brevundimonas sp. SL130]WAC60977.1 hypothetical protein OU998_05940 [Brevundimonas sp. SL130]
MSFSATDAAFEGFRVTRGNPLPILLWALVWLAGLFIASMVAVPIAAPYAAEIQSAAGDPSALSAEATRAVYLMTAMAAPFVIGVQSIVSAAVYRAVLEPENKAYGFLRLGRDELRLLLVTIIVTAISFAVSSASEFLVRFSSEALGLLGGFFFNLLGLALSVFLSVRLSLIAPLTLKRHKFSFAEGWRMSGRVFWPLLGITVLAFVMALFVVVLLFLIGWPLAAALGGTGAGALLPNLLLLLLIPFGAMLVSVLLWTPFAATVRDIA